MSNISDEYMKNIIVTIATIFKLKEWQYSLRSFENIAQNYFGILVPIVLYGKSNEKEIKIPLILKSAPTNEECRVSGAVTIMFIREIFVYSVLFKKYKVIQQKLSPLHHFIAPNCYYVCEEYCKEVIVMEDMCEEGYKPYVHPMFLDLDHIIVSLRSLAKFHALSFILKREDKQLYDEVVKLCVPLTAKSNKRYMDILKDRLVKALDKLKNTNYVSLLESLKENCDNVMESATYSAFETCICHGDMWKENILFKYENGKPISACIIDYQTTRISSPAYDVLYLIASSTNSEVRGKHFNQLLNIYYETFIQVLQEAGMSTNVYPRKEFDKDLVVVGPACLIVANTALWLSNGLQEDGVVRSKHVWTTDQEKAAAVDKYRSIIKGIINDFSSYGYLSTIN